MTRTWLLLALVIVLGVAVYVISSSPTDDKAKALSYERTFHVDDINKINEVHLSYKNGQKVKIARDGNRWMINDSFPIFKPVIEVFLRTLRDIKVDYTPPKAALPVAQKDFEQFGIDVVILDKRGNVLQDYIIGGVTPDEKGTYARRPKSDNPFVLRIPFLEASIRGRFEVRPEEWRDRFIFQEKWDDIKSVTLEYPRARSSSFTLTADGSRFYVEALDGEHSSERQAITRGQAEAYLMHFEKLGCEAYENDHPKRDSVTTLIPYCNLTLERKDGEVKWLKLYPINDMTGDVDLTRDYLNSGRLFRYLGEMHNEDFIFIQQFTIGKVLVPYRHFSR